MSLSRPAPSRRPARRAPRALGSRLLRGVLGVFGGYLLAFHALALWRRIEEASLLQTGVALRWLASALLLVLLWRLRGGLRSRRRLIALSTLVLLLHLGAGGPIDLQHHPDASRPLLVVLPVGLALGGFALLGLGPGLGRTASLGLPAEPSGRIAIRLGVPPSRTLLRSLAARAPPVVSSLSGR